jgi:hypothetical protein
MAGLRIFSLKFAAWRTGLRHAANGFIGSAGPEQFSVSRKR